jgi:glycosyltransferase involved in cell wall biosynthesis
MITPSVEPCGVEVFTRKLVGALVASDPAAGDESLPIGGGWRELVAALPRVARADRVVFSFPLVAWKRVLFTPLLLLLTSMVTRRRTVVFLHEWNVMHWLRRLVVAPFVVLSGRIVVLSPYVRGELAGDRWLGWAARKCQLVPHPPSIAPPPERLITDTVRRVEDAARTSDIVIGYFGAIYKGKAPDALLDICAHLRAQGRKVAIVFIGSFTQSLDQYEDQFRARVKALGLADQVIVTGYVDTEQELFALFERIGAFLFLFPEGMTARRSSVIACLQSGRPVIVSAPRTLDEFAHHRGLSAVIASGALSFVPQAAGVGEITDALVTAAARQYGTATVIDREAWWADTTAATRAVL